MYQEIEYAEMLEIPVSTVNVERKKRKGKKTVKQALAATYETDVKDSVIAQVNGKLSGESAERIIADAALFAESANSAGDVRFDSAPVAQEIETLPFYTESERAEREYAFGTENDVLAYEPRVESKAERRVRRILNAEFIAACALCGAIFLTNVFMPGSAINTFFSTLQKGGNKTDDRGYAEFTLSGVVSDQTDVELTLSPTGVLSFVGECCVYPAADGTVSEIVEENGVYTVKISHSDTFTGVIEGLDYVYYAKGDSVKANVPIGFTDGDGAVQVTMYSEGELLNCFEITEENCLAWLEQK